MKQKRLEYSQDQKCFHMAYEDEPNENTNSYYTIIPAAHAEDGMKYLFTDHAHEVFGESFGEQSIWRMQQAWYEFYKNRTGIDLQKIIENQ